MDKELISVFKQIIKNELSPINERLINIEGQQKENTSILRALELASEIHNAELDSLNHQTANINGKINNLKKETNDKLDNLNNAVKEIHSDVSLANVTASKNRIDIEMMKNVINK